jgi:LmbE family N-acetylglucosaminyl deacetylase
MLGGVATVVAFHAHPDDEVLLTGGTLALLAAQGHRVVIAVATDGAMGAATSPGSQPRLAELQASASVLGAARVVHLGYADSGHGPILFPDPPDRARFARADLAEAAARLAAVIREERADLLLSYDARGGYGHRDHIRVHEVGALAAGLTGVRVLEATVPRELVGRLARPLQLLRLTVRYDADGVGSGFTPEAEITHRVSVGRYARQKQAALAAHHSQTSGKSRAGRLFHLLASMPAPLFRLAGGHEWFAEPGASLRAARITDVLQPASRN